MLLATLQERFGTRRVKMGRVVALVTVFLLCSLEGCLAAPSPAANSLESGTVPSSDGDITPSQAKPVGYIGCIAKLYRDYNYGGTRKTIVDATKKLSDYDFNEEASSAIIEGTCDWIFYKDSSFTDNEYILTPGNYPRTSDWGQDNDKLSSLRPVPPSGTEAIVLFEHQNFRGKELVLYLSVSNLKKHNYNDKTGSVAVTGGSWRLYRGTDYGGDSVTVGTGYHNKPGGNNNLSSVKKL